MKTPQVKYTEAVTRNLDSLMKKVGTGDKTFLQDHNLTTLRIRTGIRASDFTFDDQLQALLDSVKKPEKKEKAEKPAKEEAPNSDVKAVLAATAEKRHAKFKRPGAATK